MEKLILIKYGELSTKKANKNFFIKTLNEDIKKNLKDDVEIKYDFGRMFVIPKNNNFDEVIKKLKNIFGIHEIIVAYKLENKEIDTIKNSIIEMLNEINFNTFKVEVKRSDKKYPIDGMELRQIFGGHILKNIPNIKVDVNNPDIVVNVEIRLKDVFIYSDKIKRFSVYQTKNKN